VFCYIKAFQNTLHVLWKIYTSFQCCKAGFETPCIINMKAKTIQYEAVSNFSYLSILFGKHHVNSNEKYIRLFTFNVFRTSFHSIYSCMHLGLVSYTDSCSHSTHLDSISIAAFPHDRNVLMKPSIVLVAYASKVSWISVQVRRKKEYFQ
jgi:hypothetical protein